VSQIDVELPEEAHDMTATGPHNELMARLGALLAYLFTGRATVIMDIFLRLDDVEQVAPDLLIAQVSSASHRVYRVPPLPVPDVTIEILSFANYGGEGREALERKRELFGRIGVPFHLEIDPERGYITLWRNVDGVLVVRPPSDRFDGPELGGAAIVVEPGRVRTFLPDGREYVSPADETARAEAERARADRLRQRLVDAGIDPDAD
jgi:Uma2 family endonuclease